MQKKSQQLSTYWGPRNDRIDEWLKLETLFDPNEKGGYETAVTNDPTTVLAMAVHLLSGSPIKHRATVGGQDEAAYKKAGKLERGLEGWWSLMDDLSFFSGRDSTQRELASWVTLMGWYAVGLGMTEGKDKQLLPIFDMHDPRDAYPEYGSRIEGLRSYVHKWTTTLAEAQGLAEANGISPNAVAGDPTQQVDIIDYHTLAKGRVAHTAMFQLYNNRGSEWLKREEDLDITSIPIMVGPVAGSPYRRAHSGATQTDWMQRLGLSVLEANRGLWTKFNEYYSLLLEVAKNHAEPDKIMIRIEDPVGERRTDLRQGGNRYYTDDLQARIVRDTPERMPFEVLQVLERLSQETQRGGFPHVLYGGLDTNLSGFAISQMLNTAMYKLGPYKLAMERIYKQADRWYLDEFKRRDTGRITLSGKTHGQGIFLETFHPDDIPKNYAIEPAVDLTLPSDMLERISIVRQAIPGNEAILDVMTALEDVIKVDDPKLVRDRMRQDKLARNPDVERLEAITSIRARAQELDNEGAKELAGMFREFAQFLVQQAGQVTGQAPTQRREAPSDALPPEMQGISPSAVRATRNPGVPNVRERLGI